MNRLISLLILVIVLGCTDSKKNRKETISKSIEKNEPIKEEINSESGKQKIEFTETEKEIAVVALSFHNWYIKNTNEMKSEVPTDFVVTEGKNNSCIVDYEPYFNELRKLGTISNSFMEKEKERTKLCAETISEMNWSEYIGVIPENCDDYLFWTRSQEETSGIELMSIKKENDAWKIKFHLYNSFGNEKKFLPYNGIINVEKEEKGYRITQINWK
jgi:hypothetical protein